MSTHTLPIILLPVIAMATNGTNSTSSSDDDNLGGLEVWEVALAGGVAGLALLLCLIACYINYRKRSKKDDVEMQSKPTNKVAPASASGAASGAEATQVPVGTAMKIKEAVSGNQGCIFEGMTMRFPCSWGCPGEEILKNSDKSVKLPGNFGMGSKPLKRWIESQMLEDARKKSGMDKEQRKPFPDKWGKRPKLTEEEKKQGLVRAAGGYGCFHPKHAKWIEDNINRDAAAAKSA